MASNSETGHAVNVANLKTSSVKSSKMLSPLKTAVRGSVERSDTSGGAIPYSIPPLPTFPTFAALKI